MNSTTNTDVTTHQVSIGFTMTPRELNRKIGTDKNYQDIYARENDKINYLSTLLSSEELTGAAIDNHHMVVLPKSIYQY